MSQPILSKRKAIAEMSMSQGFGPDDIQRVHGSLAIGLTGAFGSGCTTAAQALRHELGFHFVRLSEAIRKDLAAAGNANPTRVELQKRGDELRETFGGGVLVAKAIQQLPQPTPQTIVFDGIRNLEEVNLLHEAFGHRFTLFSIVAPTQTRWDRIGATNYLDQGRTQRDFIEDDRRDRNEEIPHGQQVELCSDHADVFLDNAPPTDTGSFRAKVIDYAKLVLGKDPRHPRQDEILMNMAYAASHSSKCLKRHVGAVVVDGSGQVVGVGYNENPLKTKPCVEEPEYGYRCFRDNVRNEHFIRLSETGARCPVCGKALTGEKGPPWRCKFCLEQQVKTNLEEYFFPDRALNWCTAIHAEVWAILAAGDRSREATLFSTTFPCFQCSEQIAQAGIKRVYYTESYPDSKGAQRLRLAGIEVLQFEGVRSSKFERIFRGAKPV